MESLHSLYRIGRGPSSSHTIGPQKAAKQIKDQLGEDHTWDVFLYGSLGATGKGHLTDVAICDVLGHDRTTIHWCPEIRFQEHANAMEFRVRDMEGTETARRIAFSTGGGSVTWQDSPAASSKTIYPHDCMEDIIKWTDATGDSLSDYVFTYEPEMRTYLPQIWRQMKATIREGLNKEGVLPGGLGVSRKASTYMMRSKESAGLVKNVSRTFGYALAVSEENAAGGVVVTAPTCGSAGVVPGVLYQLKQWYHLPENKICNALAVGGVIGNLVKTNASISGAEVGCQGEVGTACAMGASAAAYLLGAFPHQIEYAAEMAMEHHLGLTCDPVGGLVQVPCIERNAMAAVRAVDCAVYALLSDGRHKISFDQVVTAMYETGRDLMAGYRETSQGGLAKWFRTTVPQN